MSGYVKDSLQKFQHTTQNRSQHSPHQWMAPNYVSTSPQIVHPTDNYPALNPDEANNFHKLVGTFLYYECAVSPTMLVAMNTIAAEQLKIIK